MGARKLLVGAGALVLVAAPFVFSSYWVGLLTEIVILAKVLWDVWGLARKYQRGKGQRWELVTWLLAATTCWTCASLVVSMLISVPPLNTLIHGTFVVAGHAMGSMLGIDTMGLLAVLTWFYLEDRGGQVQLPRWPALPMCSTSTPLSSAPASGTSAISARASS